jgi:hypothetical protein
MRVDQWSPAEHAIQAAIDVIESMGCDPLLTEAVILLARGRNHVADFVDRRLLQEQDTAVNSGSDPDKTCV